MENNKKSVRIEATTTGLQAFADELQSHVEAAENREAHKLQYSIYAGPAQPIVQYIHYTTVQRNAPLRNKPPTLAHTRESTAEGQKQDSHHNTAHCWHVGRQHRAAHDIAT